MGQAFSGPGADVITLLSYLEADPRKLSPGELTHHLDPGLKSMGAELGLCLWALPQVPREAHSS